MIITFVCRIFISNDVSYFKAKEYTIMFHGIFYVSLLKLQLDSYLLHGSVCEEMLITPLLSSLF